MALENGLMVADVFHQRLTPKKHTLKYKVYYLCFPIGKLRQLPSRLLSLNRFNLLGFYEKDHGFSTKPLENWVRETLASYQVTKADGDIILLSMPRVLGYGFNPVSFWFCLDQDKLLRAVVVEVNNTFGERHCYICFHDNQAPIGKDDWIAAKKAFHVSPFLKVQGDYKFRFAYEGKKVGVWIDYYDGGKKTVVTSLIGKRIKLNDLNLAWCFFRYPLLTLK